jgi:HTH-type transcriptional regulator, competence development regulator
MVTSPYSPFGGYLRSIRERRGWTLDELARRFHSDRANMHRIERGNSRPRYETVSRLVEALEATSNEAIALYERAGYQAPLWPTSTEDFATLRKEVSADWFEDGPPATVVTDAFWTVWHANATFARLLTRSEPAKLTGLHYITICLDPDYGFRDALSRLAKDEDIEMFLTVVVARLRRRIEAKQGGVKSDDDFAHLVELPGFRDLWSRAGAGHYAASDVLSGLIRLKLRDGGCLIVGSATVIRDRRFLFTHYLPIDEKTAMALSALPST